MATFATNAYRVQLSDLRIGADVRVLLAFGVFSLLARATALPHSVGDPDESLYFVQAQRWLHGAWPYSTGVWDMHPAGAPALLAIAFGLLGEAIWVARVLASLSVAVTAFLLHRLLVLSGAGRDAGVAAGLLYIAFTLKLGGLATNTEVLFAPFATGAALVIYAAILRARRGEAVRARDAATAGLLAGVAIWIKYVVAIEAAVACCVLAAAGLLRRRVGFGGAFALAAVYAVACWTPTAATALAYALRGELADFAYANFGVLLRYVGNPATGVDPARAVALALFSFAVPAVLAASAALWSTWRPSAWPAPQRVLLALVAVWFAAAAAGVASTAKFYNHHFLALLPALAAASGLALARAGEQLAGPAMRGVAVVAVAMLLAAAPVAEDLANRAERGFSIGMDDTERRVAAAVRRHIAPGETLWVVNHQPVVYFLARAEPASRYVLPTHLVGDQRHIVGVDAEAEIARLLASRPGVIVLDRRRWPEVDGSLARLLETALAESYTLAEAVPDRGLSVEVHRLR